MKHSILATIALICLASSPGIAGEDRKPKALNSGKANCQLKLTKQASGGSMMLSYNAKTPDDCLKLQDSETEALYRPAVAERRRGAGPRE